MTELTTQKDAALAAIDAAATLEALEAERVAALGKKGWVSLALKTLGQMSPEERQEAAPAIQAVGLLFSVLLLATIPRHLRHHA